MSCETIDEFNRLAEEIKVRIKEFFVSPNYVLVLALYMKFGLCIELRITTAHRAFPGTPEGCI